MGELMGVFPCPKCGKQQLFDATGRCTTCGFYRPIKRRGKVVIREEDKTAMEELKVVKDTVNNQPAPEVLKEGTPKEKVVWESDIAQSTTICLICHSQLVLTEHEFIKANDGHVCISCATTIRDNLLEYLRRNI
jgi:ribosomal protein L37E